MKGLTHEPGERFGRLVVIAPAVPATGGQRRWLCHCDCGMTALVVGSHMRNGRTRSCGCLAQESRSGLVRGGGPDHSGGNASSAGSRLMTATVAGVVPNKASYDPEVPIDWIRPSILNPRTEFDADGLAELAASIKAHGILEPLVVRWVEHTRPETGARSPAESTPYELICGERRLRAAKLAGLATVPVRNLGDVDDNTALQLALIENLQRKDLNPLEEARAFQTLNRVVGLKQSQIAAAVHRSQPAVANRMRLLDLPDDVQAKISSGELSPAHGIALAKYKDWPRFVEALAEIAATKRLPSADLEGDPPWHIRSELQSKGVIKSVERYAQAFDMAVCLTCPFGAYRNWAHGGGTCLNPSHWEELEAAAKADREAKTAAVVAKTVEKALAVGAELPKIDDLPRGSYERIEGTPPGGCSVDCACRSAALHWGGKAVPICTSPRQFQLLKRRDTIAHNKLIRKDADDLAKRMRVRLDRLEALGEIELIILASQAIGQNVQSYKVHPGYQQALKRATIAYADHSDPKTLGTIARAYGPLCVPKLALEAILNAELELYREGTRGAPELTRLFLGDEPEAARG